VCAAAAGPSLRRSSRRLGPADAVASVTATPPPSVPPTVTAPRPLATPSPYGGGGLCCVSGCGLAPPTGGSGCGCRGSFLSFFLLRGPDTTPLRAVLSPPPFPQSLFLVKVCTLRRGIGLHPACWRLGSHLSPTTVRVRPGGTARVERHRCRSRARQPSAPTRSILRPPLKTIKRPRGPLRTRKVLATHCRVLATSSIPLEDSPSLSHASLPRLVSAPLHSPIPLFFRWRLSCRTPSERLRLPPS